MLDILQQHIIQVIYTLNRVTHKWWDCKDDLELKNMTIWSLIFYFCIQSVFCWCVKCSNTDISQFWPTMNPECKITDYTNSVQSSLKYNPLWVSLYIYNMYICMNKQQLRKQEQNKKMYFIVIFELFVQI